MTKLQRYTIVSIIFLAFLPLLYQFMHPKLSADELFSNNFTAQKFLVTRASYRGGDEVGTAASKKTALEQKALYFEAVEAYSKEEFASAALLFERYLNQAPAQQKEVALYLGIAYLSTNQTQAAKSQFKYLLEKGSANKKQDAEWYLVLTLLKEKEIAQVRERLEAILAQSHPHAYREKAQTLLEEIQRQYQP